MNGNKLTSITIHSKGSGSPDATLHYWRSGETNLGYFLHPNDSKRVICVDVPNGDEVLEVLEGRGWTLSALLLTHQHHDHVNGLEKVVEKTGCTFYVARPYSDVPRQHVSDGLEWQIEGLGVLAIDTSGHSECDFSYYFADLDLCFCADTLFQWGCGRMFAGPAERLWKSLLRLRSLPRQTRFCCGHDFRQDNKKFIQNELSGWSKSESVLATIQESINTSPTSEPFTLEEQIATNPFLRCDDPEIARILGRVGAGPAEVFAELRSRRNRY